MVFIQEALGLLTDAEDTLLSLESSGFSVELVNKAFRLAHNFKGSAKSVGFSELGDLAHRYEDILSAIKSGQINLSPEVITALLKTNDRLKHEIESLQVSLDHKVNIEVDLERLDRIAQNLCGRTSALETVNSTSESTQPQSGEGVDFGLFLSEPEPLKSPGAQVSQKSLHQAVPPAPSATGQPPPGRSEEMHRVPASRLDTILNIIGEIVVNQSILDECRTRDDTGSAMAMQAIGYMSKLVFDLQNISLSLRLTPIKPLFQKLKRTARDVAESLGKPVNFVDEGDYCEIDKGVIDKIADPLNHMIRNAIDHGIDTPDERVLLGKSATPTVSLKVAALDDQVKITIQDDGRGLNKEKIMAKATSSGIVRPGKALTDQEIFRLIFAPGFSTKEQVTDVSGRGVGMEVVQRAVDDLKGSIDIKSQLNKGTIFEISLPLSLSIIAGMVISAAGQQFVIPISHLVETIELNKFKIESLNGNAKALNLRGEVLPIFNLADLIGRKNPRDSDRPNGRHKADKPNSTALPVSRPALVTLAKGRKITFEVDQIENQQKVVLKRLGREFNGMFGVIGGAVLRNGEPSLVLSLDSLVAGVL
jgi:two-component system chemotaxis sensor kinase CheA